MASTYLSFPSTGTNGNQKTWTLSLWFKRGNLGSVQTLFSAGDGHILEGFVRINASDRLEFKNDGQYGGEASPTRVLRDTNAWYHLVWSVDSTQASNDDRWKIYLNGELIPASEYSSVAITSNGDGNILTYSGTYASNLSVGRRERTNADYWDGQITHLHLIDGTQYQASDFGETDATTGIWKPKTAPSVTYGTNGFFLKFENSGAFGTDSSGNANNFTVNGTMTQTIDTPSNVFATMNPLYQSVYGGSSAILTNGNTKWTGTSNDTSQNATLGTLGVSSGKWYWEVKGNMAYDSLLGIAKSNFDPNGGTGGLQNPGWWGLVTNISATSGSGLKFVVDNTFGSSTGITLANGDIINIALDATNLKFYIGKNGTWLNSGNPTSGATGTGSIATLPSDTTFLPACSNYGYNTANSWEFNFGNGYFGTTVVSSAENPDDGIGIFEYAVPTGYKALCTKSINAQEYD